MQQIFDVYVKKSIKKNLNKSRESKNEETTDNQEEDKKPKRSIANYGIANRRQ